MSTSNITKQSGAASSTPSAFRRWLTSKIMTRVASESALLRSRKKSENRRIKQGQPHTVEYFHQVGDAYSFLAVQILAQFSAKYDISLKCHLVRPATGANTPEPDLLEKLALYDARLIADQYGLMAPKTEKLPSSDLQYQAQAILAALNEGEFASIAPQIECALWRADSKALALLDQEHGKCSEAEQENKLNVGTERRKALGHYSGAMFYYDEEWYWGIDRLHHLENRLTELGLDQKPGQPHVAPRPLMIYCNNNDSSQVTLEYYISLRSPYSAVSWRPTLELAERTGVKLVIKPVLPMVMRGVPATRQKGMYIFRDAAREARALQVPYGKFYDPIGEPVSNCYSIYPWAIRKGKGDALLGAFLDAAFVHGINTNNLKGLRKVVEAAGLDWNAARNHIGEEGWEDLLERNRQEMYDFGSWGVPSYRLLDQRGREALGVWGQDRLWLVAKTISDLNETTD